MVYIIVQLRKQLIKLCRNFKDWLNYKHLKACASSFRLFRWKYRYCKWKHCRRPKCDDSSSFLGIRTALWHIMAYLHLVLHLHSWVLEQQAVAGNFSNKIFFSDDAHFTYGGYANNIIVVFGVLRFLKQLKRGHYIQKKSLFVALFVAKVWLDLISSKTTMERLLPSVQSVMVIW